MRESQIELMLFLGQDSQRIGEMTVSDMDAMFESETFKTWKQLRDADLKLPGILIGRIDGLAKQINGLSRALATRSGR